MKKTTTRRVKAQPASKPSEDADVPKVEAAEPVVEKAATEESVVKAEAKEGEAGLHRGRKFTRPGTNNQSRKVEEDKPSEE